MKNAEELADWIATAEVEHYKKEKKEVFVASKNNEYLILTNHRLNNFPIMNLIWLANGISQVLYQDLGDHSIIGDIEGIHTARENLETVWFALHKKTISY